MMFLEMRIEHYLNNKHGSSLEPLENINHLDLALDIIDYIEDLYPKLTLTLQDFNVINRQSKNKSILVVKCFDCLRVKCLDSYPELAI